VTDAKARIVRINMHAVLNKKSSDFDKKAKEAAQEKA